jgi:hypothetical protein
MSLGHGSSLVRLNLKSNFDAGNIKSYSGTGTAWLDLQRLQSYSNTMEIGAGSESWMGSSSSEITINTVIDKKETFVGYAEHPIKKWTGTSDASFVLYHFGTTGGSDLFMWYANRNGAWGPISGGFYGVNGQKYIMTLQYNNTTGGQLWINGSKIGSRTGSGSRANSADNLKIFGPIGSSSIAIKNFQIYDRELSDLEINQNFNALRGRYSI